MADDPSIPISAEDSPSVILELIYRLKIKDVMTTALIAAKRDIGLRLDVEQYVRPINFRPGALTFEAAPGAPGNLAGRLVRFLKEHTGQPWLVAAEGGGGAERRGVEGVGAPVQGDEAAARRPGGRGEPDHGEAVGAKGGHGDLHKWKTPGAITSSKAGRGPPGGLRREDRTWPRPRQGKSDHQPCRRLKIRRRRCIVPGECPGRRGGVGGRSGGM